MLKVIWMDFYNKYLLDLWTQDLKRMLGMGIIFLGVVFLFFLVSKFFSYVTKYGFWISVYCFFRNILMYNALSAVLFFVFFDPDIGRYIDEKFFSMFTAIVFFVLLDMDGTFESNNVPFTKKYQEKNEKESRRRQLEMN